jgi:hypothetical protein
MLSSPGCVNANDAKVIGAVWDVGAEQPSSKKAKVDGQISLWADDHR